MTDRRKLILGIGMIVAVALIAISLVLVLSGPGRELFTDYITRGDSAYESGDYEGAIVLYKKALEDNPKSEDAYIGLIRAYKSLGQDYMLGYLVARAIENNIDEKNLALQAGIESEDIAVNRGSALMVADGQTEREPTKDNRSLNEETNESTHAPAPSDSGDAEDGVVAENKKCTVSGKIVDATTGAELEGFNIIVHKGGVDGEIVSSFSAGWGGYSIELEKGDYTIVAQPTNTGEGGYEETYMQVKVSEETQYLTQNITVTPVLKRGEIRIVLEWSDFPSDLDSYLMGSSSTGSNVFVNYVFRDSTDSNGKVAELDVDCRYGYGPETITIYDVEGDYEFSVVDYWADTNKDKDLFRSCGAVVKVYTDEGEKATIRVSDCGSNSVTDDFLWSVCRISKGEVIVLNTFEDTTFSPGSK